MPNEPSQIPFEDPIIWNEGEDDESGRIINCDMDRTMEQEETVQFQEGFEVHSEDISLSKSTTDGIDQAETKLLFGEMTQGFMTVQDQPAKRVANVYKGNSFTFFFPSLASYLVSDHLCISESLDDQALGVLINVSVFPANVVIGHSLRRWKPSVEISKMKHHRK
ncbi:hypothetical protein SCLCIDRAFT_31032 [Scleroderma citrinum Foug A]|uniref:Uncharacterized protein n=1 Tax=Scleroderma citrinum Foug A TaxID=1036808 RepID=A0A0C2YY21_9AGAM|nr:hypothetical protein SCLCIDRAFT_31032 [Scleroderma citrinum Foug A]